MNRAHQAMLILLGALFIVNTARSQTGASASGDPCDGLFFTWPNYGAQPDPDPLEAHSPELVGPETRYFHGEGWTSLYTIHGTITRQKRSRIGNEFTTSGNCEERFFFTESSPPSGQISLSLSAGVSWNIFGIGVELYTWNLTFGEIQQTLWYVPRQECTIWYGRYWEQEKRADLEFNGMYSYLKTSAHGEVLESETVIAEQDISDWKHDDFKWVPAVSKRCM
jgi:hypothetical protein